MDSNHLIIHINVKTGLQDNYLKFEDGQIILGIKINYFVNTFDR